MKISKTFKKITSSFLLFAVFVVSSFSAYPTRVEALFGIGGGGAGANTGVNLKGVGAFAVTCGVAYFASRKALKKAAVLEEKGEDAVTQGVGSVVSGLTGVDPTSATDEGTTPKPMVPVVAEGVEVKITEEVVKVDTEATLQSFKEECLDALTRMLVLKIIDKITFMTVEWINSGFEGNPFYPEDRPNFFEQIARDEVTSFTAWFSLNPADYPFGKILSETILLTVQNRLQENLRFSLNQVLQHNNQYASYENFQARFSVGGWAGYTAFARPNNNIFGNYITANNYLARQTAGTNINIAKNFQQELTEAGGLLNQRVCRLTETGDPNDEYVGKNEDTYMGDYTVMPSNGLVSDILEFLPGPIQAELADVPDPNAQRELYNYFVQRSHCAKWETVTPGRFIAEQTSQALGSPLRNLELTDEFNENLGLIFDALAAQLFKKGLRALQRSDGQYSSDPASPNYNALWAQANDSDFGLNSNQPTTQDLIQGNTSGGNGGSGGGDTPAVSLLVIQQQYLTRANEMIQILTTLIRDIRALDYCVPGPNPNWYQNGLISLQSMINSNVSEYGDAPYYAGIVAQFTGITIPESVVPNYGQFSAFINFVLNKYQSEINANYLPLLAPPQVRPIATNYYSQIENFQTRIQIIQSEINALIPVLPQIQAIQAQFEALTPEQQSDSSSSEMQTITSLLNQIVNQGVLVNQSQLNQLNQDISSYNSQIFTVNNYITQCVEEVSNNNYTALEERVPYPSQSIFENPSVAIPALQPNVNRFLSTINFGDTDSEINLSGFNNLNLTVPTTSTETFANHLQSVF